MDIEDDEISPAIRVQVRLVTARSALRAALAQVPQDDLAYHDIYGCLHAALDMAEQAQVLVRRITGV